MRAPNPETTLHTPILTAMNLPWRRLIDPSRKMLVPQDAWFSRCNSDPLDFFYLAKGKILVMHADAEGNERAVFCLGSGNLFNEAPAAAGFDAPNSPFFTMQECLVYRFSNALMRDPAFVSANPDLVINLMQGLAIKLLIMHTSLCNFTGVTALGRLSRFFYGLAEREQKMEFDLSLTQEALAILLGMNRATIVRALKDLKDSGALLKFTKHKLILGDIDLLKKLAGSI